MYLDALVNESPDKMGVDYTYGTSSSSSASSSSVDTSSMSSLSFCHIIARSVPTLETIPETTDLFYLQLLLERPLAVVQAAECVDLVLVLLRHFGVRRAFVLFFFR